MIIGEDADKEVQRRFSNISGTNVEGKCPLEC